MALLALDKLNISVDIVSLLLYGLSLKLFFIGTSEILRLLLTIFEISLEETSNTN